jgi:hypothetical protein
MELTVRECEKAIGEKAEKWKGRCYEIACAIDDAGLTPGAIPRYGHWHGPVNPDGYFGNYTHIPPRHGWLELEDGSVLDPTKWVFLDCKPHIFVADPDTPEHDHYDIGGELLMTQLERDVPPSLEELQERGDDSMTQMAIEWPEEVKPLLRRLYGSDEGLFKGFVFHLANRGPKFLGDAAKPIYEALVGARKGAWIPIDYRQAVLGSSRQEFA